MASGLKLSPGQVAPLYSHPWRRRGRYDCRQTLTAAPADALLANGVMAHADETHISHNTSRSHSGGLVVPAAFAVGHDIAIGGTQQLLRAADIGPDVGSRV